MRPPGKTTIGNTYNISPFDLADWSVFGPDRLLSPNLGIHDEKGFGSCHEDRIFVIGSCFAREIHSALSQRGFAVRGEGVGNKYSTFGILQTLQWALHGGLGERHMIPLADATWLDPHRHPQTFFPTARAAVNAHQAILDRTAADLRSSDAVVITLGLVEAWYDQRESVWLNGTPPVGRMAVEPGRFTPRRTTHAQNLAALLDILALLRTVNPGFRIIVSVSPVPLYATFFGEDVLVANAYSKATLRSVVTEARLHHRSPDEPAFDYFPSYELVTLSDRNQVWRTAHGDGTPDGRHVRAEFVRDVIVKTFVDHYLSREQRSRTAADSGVTTEPRPSPAMPC